MAGSVQGFYFAGVMPNCGVERHVLLKANDQTTPAAKRGHPSLTKEGTVLRRRFALNTFPLQNPKTQVQNQLPVRLSDY